MSVDQPTRMEITVPAEDVETTVARVCAEWGVDRDAIQIDALTLPEGMGGKGARVRLLIKRRGLEEASEAAAMAGLDLERAASLGRQVLADILERMKIKAEVVAEWGEPDPEDGMRSLILDVRGEDLGMLIGRRGETLSALQYLTRLIVCKQLGEGLNLVVDVAGHKRRREVQLRRLARRMAEQALQRKRVMTLEPMPPEERRIIHLELRDHLGVFTESVGEGSRRKVTIVPKGLSK